MAYDFSEFKSSVQEAKEWLQKEYQGIHTGRATPAVLDRIKVEAYGALQQIPHVANVSIEDPRTLLVAPWDKETIKNVESAIRESNLGLGLSVGESGIRVTFPELTGEKREMLKKLAREKLEDARISVRKAREEIWEEIQKQEKDGDITEDDKFAAKEELQRLVDKANEELEGLASDKESEISR